jgi:hypothetical protein
MRSTVLSPHHQRRPHHNGPSRESGAALLHDIRYGSLDSSWLRQNDDLGCSDMHRSRILPGALDPDSFAGACYVGLEAAATRTSAGPMNPAGVSKVFSVSATSAQAPACTVWGQSPMTAR